MEGRKKWIPCMAMFFVLTYSGVSAAYVIQLKNGHEFTTYHYWTAGDQILFYFADGIVGVDKDFVREVKKSKPVQRRIVESRQEVIGGKDSEQGSTIASPTTVPVPASEARRAKPNQEEKKSQEKAPVDFAYYQQKNAELRGELEKALERYRSASASKDKEAKEKAREEFRAISKKLFALSDELKAKNNGVLPEWWEKI
jgi:hypothetical protein